MGERRIRWARPSLAISLCALGAFVMLVGLGVWQLDRLAWKTDLLDRVDTRMHGATLPLPPLATHDPESIERWDYQRVTVSGIFLHEYEIPLAARYHRGTLGYQILTPLERSDGHGLVLVNRGWVPSSRKLPETRPESLVVEEQTLRGVARLPGRPGLFAPDNDPETGFWMTVDLAAMAEARGLPLARLAPVVVEVDAGEDRTLLPVGGVTRVDFRNDHLGYAVFWFSMAAVLVVMFAAFHLRRKGEDTP